MDALLGTFTKHAVNYAVRSGITITANYVFQQSTKLIKKVDGAQKVNLLQLQEQLDNQIKIISPAIDLIELFSARGNTSLESAKGLTQSVRMQIQALGQRIAQAVVLEETLSNSKSTKETEAADIEVKSIINDIQNLLRRLDVVVPLFNLAISASGTNLSGALPNTVSPSRLLQASNFLTVGDARYGGKNSGAVLIGPTFTLSLYMLFAGHARPVSEEDIRNTTWKEVMHKMRLKVLRVPLENLYDLPGVSVHATNDNDNLAAETRKEEYAYQIVMIEDLDDDRVHTFEDDEPQPKAFHGVHLAGIREVIPVHEISKIFYADTGKILNIGQDSEMNSPILLLRRDIHASPPRKMMSRIDESINSVENPNLLQKDSNSQHLVQSETSATTSSCDNSTAWNMPSGLDPEWLALEIYDEAADSDTESTTSPDGSSRAHTNGSKLVAALSNLELDDSATYASASQHTSPSVPTSLSLLEVLLRLLSLQQFQQTSHMSVSDELLNFFLSEAATTGAVSGDDVERRKIRNEARQRLGFDPYDESPVKRRGEDYQTRGGMALSTNKDAVSITDTSFDSSKPDFLKHVHEPATPRQVLDNRPNLSPYSTPDLPPLPRSASSSRSPQTTPTGAARFRAIQEQVRRASPLARKMGSQRERLDQDQIEKH